MGYALALAALILLTHEQVALATEVYFHAEMHPAIKNSRWFADIAGKKIATAGQELLMPAKRATVKSESQLIKQITSSLQRPTLQSCCFSDVQSLSKRWLAILAS